MGSEGPPTITIHVTGFKKFHGVSENPTETIVSNLKEYVKKMGLPKGVTLGNCSTLETAGQGTLGPLYQLLQSSVSKKDSESSNGGRVIWVSWSHLLYIITANCQMIRYYVFPLYPKSLGSK